MSRLKQRLASEEKLLARWMTRLRRPFHAIEKQQRIVARLQKSIFQAEGLGTCERRTV